ncbi:unnamed protein product [Blepharisma stoltei]|uniref:AAA+ ATPase domain-containing protein n=1 Tax=Blepharisma stoltei TaxID=1481888 RepID=A0AAU9JWQ2_9CILI|nr:unnamed protein product [Blepharisma stoltei]
MVITRGSAAKRKNLSPGTAIKKVKESLMLTADDPRQNPNTDEINIDIKITKKSNKIKYTIDDDNDTDNAYQTPKVNKNQRLFNNSDKPVSKSVPPKRLEESSSDANSESRYPPRNRKPTKKMIQLLESGSYKLRQKQRPLQTIKRVSKIKENSYKFRDYIEISNLEWIGNPEVKYTRGGKDLIFYEKIRNNLSQEEFSQGDIIEIYPVDSQNPIHADIIFLFDDSGEQKAEVRLIHGPKNSLVESYECIIIQITKFYQKVEFTPENGYLCNTIKTFEGSIKNVNPNERRERSLNYSKLYSELYQNKNPLLHAIALLTLSSVPSKLVGREKEVEEITEFITTSIKLFGSKNSLYICGAPGTGKTATFLYVINFLENNPEYSEKFQFVYINCMKLKSPKEIYTVLCHEIFGSQRSNKKSIEKLSDYFKNEKKEHLIVLLLDEIDALLNRKQDVIYNILNWSTLRNSNLITASIANTMNLADEFFHKIKSRMGQKQLVFAPYTRNELDSIVKKRLVDTEVFSKEAILFAAAKVASYSGDARKIFQVCKRAAFIANEQKQPIVKMEHIQIASKQLLASPISQMISQLPFYLKLFLITLCIDLKVNLQETSTVGKLKFRIAQSCDFLGKERLKLVEVEEIAGRLAAFKIIAKEEDVVKFLISPNEVIDGLKEDELMIKFESSLCGN